MEGPPLPISSTSPSEETVMAPHPSPVEPIDQTIKSEPTGSMESSVFSSTAAASIELPSTKLDSEPVNTNDDISLNSLTINSNKSESNLPAVRTTEESVTLSNAVISSPIKQELATSPVDANSSFSIETERNTEALKTTSIFTPTKSEPTAISTASTPSSHLTVFSALSSSATTPQSNVQVLLTPIKSSPPCMPAIPTPNSLHMALSALTVDPTLIQMQSQLFELQIGFYSRLSKLYSHPPALSNPDHTYALSLSQPLAASNLLYPPSPLMPSNPMAQLFPVSPYAGFNSPFTSSNPQLFPQQTPSALHNLSSPSQPSQSQPIAHAPAPQSSASTSTAPQNSPTSSGANAQPGETPAEPVREQNAVRRLTLAFALFALAAVYFLLIIFGYITAIPRRILSILLHFFVFDLIVRYIVLYILFVYHHESNYPGYEWVIRGTLVFVYLCHCVFHHWGRWKQIIFGRPVAENEAGAPNVGNANPANPAANQRDRDREREEEVQLARQMDAIRHHEVHQERLNRIRNTNVSTGPQHPMNIHSFFDRCVNFIIGIVASLYPEWEVPVVDP